MKLNLVSHFDELINKGDALIDINEKGKQLIIVCPKCGELSGSAGNHKFDESTKSYTPSIIHPCGYHGFLTNGMFTNI